MSEESGKYTLVSVEKMLTGSDQLNRKKKIILNVLGILRGLLKKYPGDESYRSGENFSVDLSDTLKLSRVKGKETIQIKSTSLSEVNLVLDNLNDLPLQLVPEIYDYLPEILEQIAEKTSNEVRESIDFLISHAPEKTTTA